jgi:hypothetical protein
VIVSPCGLAQREHARLTLASHPYRIGVARGEAPARGCKGRGRLLPPAAQTNCLSKEYGHPSKKHSQTPKKHSHPAKENHKTSKEHDHTEKEHSHPAKEYGDTEKQHGHPAKEHGHTEKTTDDASSPVARGSLDQPPNQTLARRSQPALTTWQ